MLSGPPPLDHRYVFVTILLYFFLVLGQYMSVFAHMLCVKTEKANINKYMILSKVCPGQQNQAPPSLSPTATMQALKENDGKGENSHDIEEASKNII